MATEISVNKQTVEDLLKTGKNKLFVIPEYQRNYDWSEEQIETLFDDIWQFCSNNDENSKNTYFLGSIVSYINESTGEQEIIDGQQRITSLFLLLRAIYTKLNEIPETERNKNANYFINKIEPTLWSTNSLNGEVDFSKILLRSDVINNEGNEILRKILETGEVSEKATDNYSKNYLKFIELYEKNSKNDPLKIYQFICVILEKCILLPITADNQDTALTIFSTLNNRGLPLSDSDIFKAKIYNNISDIETRTHFINKWKKLEDDSKECDESIQQLFYYYMFYLRAKEKDIKTTTPGLRKYYAQDKFIRLTEPTLLDNLRKILNLWIVINKREIIDNEKWTQNIDILKILDSLKSYPNEFWKYPVVIYYLTNSENISFEKDFLIFLRRFFVTLLVKYLEVPSINNVKNDIMKLNSDIISNSHPSFVSLNIENVEFKNSLKTPNNNTVRMLLKILAYNESNQTEILPEKWEIEHIFPQRWQNNYFPTNISESEIKEHIEHLGNKLPFEKRLNIIAGNGYLGKKREQYNQSRIILVKNIVANFGDDWSLDDITSRDEVVAETLQNIIIKWTNEYDNSSVVPSKEIPNEIKKQIEALKSNGWL